MAGSIGYWFYTSDNGKKYIVKLSLDEAAAGGFEPAGAAAVLSGANPPWGFNSKDLRHVTGLSTGGKHGRLKIGKPDNGKYVSGGSFVLGGTTFNIIGAIGERRPASDIGG